MEPLPTPLATAFAALAAELRARAESGAGQGAEAAWHALVWLGLIRVILVLESMARHWQAARPARQGHTLLAAGYPRATLPPRPLTPRLRADLRNVIRPYQAPAEPAPVMPAPAVALPAAPPRAHARSCTPGRTPPGRITSWATHAPIPAHPVLSKRDWAELPSRAQYVPIT